MSDEPSPSKLRMVQRIPWLTLGLFSGAYIGGYICRPFAYYHSGFEYADHMSGFFYGALVGVFIGLMIDSAVRIFFRRRKATSETTVQTSR